MRLFDVSLVFFAALNFASAILVNDSCDPLITTTAATKLTTTAGATTAPSSKGKTTITTAPATSPTSQTTTATVSSSVKRRRRATDKECNIPNAECKNNHCTCKTTYIPSDDLSACNKQSGAPREHMSKVLVAAWFAVLALILRPM